VLVRLGKMLVIAALVLTTGAHWFALQTVAWTTMLAGNLRSHSLSEAISETFDGKHQCCLCKAIAAGKQTEKKNESVVSALKMEFPPVSERELLFAPAQFRILAIKNFFADVLNSEPPLPPPRNFPA